MLKTISVADLTASIGVENKKQNNKEIQVENQDKNEKERAQKSYKSQPKSQKTAKSKKWIQAKKVKVFRAKNFRNQSRSFLILEPKKVFTKLRQAFVKALKLNYFDLEHHV